MQRYEEGGLRRRGTFPPPSPGWWESGVKLNDTLCSGRTLAAVWRHPEQALGATKGVGKEGWRGGELCSIGLLSHLDLARWDARLRLC